LVRAEYDQLIQALPPQILGHPVASSSLLKRTLAGSDDVTKTHPSCRKKGDLARSE
jgi:hypothetical protein